MQTGDTSVTIGLSGLTKAIEKLAQLIRGQLVYGCRLALMSSDQSFNLRNGIVPPDKALFYEQNERHLRKSLCRNSGCDNLSLIHGFPVCSNGVLRSYARIAATALRSREHPAGSE